MTFSFLNIVPEITKNLFKFLTTQQKATLTAAFQKKLKKQFFLYGSKDLKTESSEIKPELFAAL